MPLHNKELNLKIQLNKGIRNRKLINKVRELTKNGILMLVLKETYIRSQLKG